MKRCLHSAAVFVVFMLACSSAALAQNPAGNRGGATPAAGRSSDSFSRPDPRMALEHLETRFNTVDEQQIKRPPERQFEVQTGPKQVTKLYRADPKLLESRFVAEVSLAPSSVLQNGFRSFDPRQQPGNPKEIMDRINLDSGRRPPSDFFRSLVELCPADQRPAAQLTFLTSPELNRDIRGMTSTGHRSLKFAIHGATSEEAKDRAAAILRLLDRGISHPLQQYFMAEGRKQLEVARIKCDAYTALSEEIRAEEEKLAQPSEVSPEILNDLKAQRIMVAVELAGLTARVKACDKMLNETNRLAPGTLQSVGDMKVKAEIERIGTQEKLDRINAFITEGDRRDAIQSTINNLSNRRNSAHTSAFRATQAAEAYIQVVEYYAPQELQGGAITISPVEWTEQ